jgi:hypothetical protein
MLAVRCAALLVGRMNFARYIIQTMLFGTQAMRKKISSTANKEIIYTVKQLLLNNESHEYISECHHIFTLPCPRCHQMLLRFFHCY